MLRVAAMGNKSMTSMAMLVFVIIVVSYQLLLQARHMTNPVHDTLVFHDSSPPRPVNASIEAPYPIPPPQPPKDQRPDCKVVEEMRNEDIVVIMRTGATESYSKLPMQLLTTLRCFEKDDFLLYSDIADTMAQFEIKDILSNVPEATRSSNPDFEVYEKMKEYKSTNQELSTVPTEWSDEEHTTAWTLDKYKFMYMLEDTYYARPEGKWYVFIETDTYMIWSNLLRYLRSLDPTKPLYLGSAAEVFGNQFAHGGSGFIITRPALEKVFGDKERGWASTWDDVMFNECCGDYVVSLPLAQADVNLHNIWPMINGEYPATMPFGPGHWCEAIITMHHIPPAEVSNVWRYEQERGYESPMQIKDLYTRFIEPQLRAHNMVQSWDNLADDVIYRASGVMSDWRQSKGWLSDAEQAAHKSGENCELACRTQSDCFQWLWKSGPKDDKTQNQEVKSREQQERKTTEIDETDKNAATGLVNSLEEDPEQGPSCSLSRTFKLGKYAPGKESQDAGPDAELWISGWNMEMIDKWVEEHQCDATWARFPY